MAAGKTVLTIAILVLVGTVVSESGLKYSITNSGDGSVLTNVTPANQLCKPLSSITTEVPTQATSQVWVVHYWGDTPDYFGFHLINSAGQMSELTYDTAYPPYCYPVYIRWDIKNTTGLISAEPIQIKNRDFDLCLTSNGVGQRVGYTMCGEESKSQFWSFKRLE